MLTADLFSVSCEILIEEGTEKPPEKDALDDSCETVDVIDRTFEHVTLQQL